MAFAFYRQLNSMDCGPVCLKMIIKHYGKHFNTDTLRSLAGFNKEGTSVLGLSEAAEQIGFKTRGVMLNFQQLIAINLPSILHWNQNHFVVLISVVRRRGSWVIKIADPSKGIIQLSKKEFLDLWTFGENQEEDKKCGVALIMTPTAAFYKEPDDKERSLNWRVILKYLSNSKWAICQIVIALAVTAGLQLLIPFFTRAVIDVGINANDTNLIIVVLLAQLALISGKTALDFIRSRILFKISNIINISILSDFWIKLTALPVSYFDLHHTGDTLQRINDHKKIQDYLTGSSLGTLFSIISLVTLSFVLLSFDKILYIVFFCGSALYVIWIAFFLGIRRKLNYKSFHIYSKENNATLQFVQGMQEIRLNNAEQLKRWDWENLQAKIFKLNLKSLTYSQIQETGSLFINQGRDLFITFLAAKLVIQGNLTLGSLVAIQYIVGQLSNPVEHVVKFIQATQDAKISLERINEVHQLQDEQNPEIDYISQLPENKTIVLERLCFKHPGSGLRFALEDISVEIEAGKVTAIVGMSGSGKTTLIKLLMKFYDYYEGDVKIGNTHLKDINPTFWRQQCGAVLQDGYIFNDSIAKNIAIGSETIDHDKLVSCAKAANIYSFVETLPNGFYTLLGTDGVGISQGQRQRLLIARALYKDPLYLFFDEATNALDANNEKLISENLKSVFSNRTVIIVAHRLSTIKNADKIIFLHEGRIVEQGNHITLTESRGMYYELVRNQFELDG
ncbi:peptidase domain-containing ABC transporter [Mucilaginibacter sp. CSA2-8R]|uniref:peptidase domain-containing ABC transporter n=1 Tax=Mucilaginibacter sp. CSA2-8R TaxID=3141542 RepID=UPI00315D8FAC